MKRMLMFLMIVTLAAVLAGCTYIKPSDTNLIDDHLGNARAFSNQVQADPNVPPAVQQWIKADAASWQWFSDIAHRRTPTAAAAK
jgi:hypothetical protein